MDEPKVYRRDFLKLIGLTVGGLAFSPQIKAIERVTRDYEGLKPTIIEGIKVYGNENPIQDTETFQKIMTVEEEKALPGIGTAYENLSRDELIKKRESILPANKRFIDVIVVESVYKRFLEIDGAVNFPTWYKKYVNDRANKFIREGIPDFELEIIPRRIMVVADQLMEGYKVERNPDSDKWHKDNFGRLPLDIDLRREFNSNYLDILGSNNHGPDGPLVENFKFVPYDNGVIHEDYHGFFALPDWYWQTGSIVNAPKYLKNIHAYPHDIMSERVDNITPATATLIKESVKRFDFRGVFADDLPKDFIYREIPPESKINFNSEKTDLGLPTVVRFLHTEGLTGRTFEEQHQSRLYQTVDIPEDEIRHLAGNGIFLSQKILNESFPYLLSEMRFPGKDVLPLLFPIPRLLFKIASWNKNESPEFNIQFTNDVYPLGRRLVLETVWAKDFENYKKEHEKDLRIFAHCLIPNTEVVNIWAWNEVNWTPLAKTLGKAVIGTYAATTVAKKTHNLAKKTVESRREKKESLEQFNDSVRESVGKLDLQSIIGENGQVVEKLPDGNKLSLKEVSKDIPLLMHLMEPTFLVLTDINGNDSIIAFPSLEKTRFDYYNPSSAPKHRVGLLVLGPLFSQNKNNVKVATAENKNYFEGNPVTYSSPEGIPWILKNGLLDLRVGKQTFSVRMPWNKNSNVVKVRIGRISRN